MCVCFSNNSVIVIQSSGAADYMQEQNVFTKIPATKYSNIFYELFSPQIKIINTLKTNEIVIFANFKTVTEQTVLYCTKSSVCWTFLEVLIHAR